MAGRIVAHEHVPWVTGIIRKIHATSYAIDLSCSRCLERSHRRFCCQDKAVKLGLDAFAKMHFACISAPKKETLV